jgi:hypothetical protein
MDTQAQSQVQNPVAPVINNLPKGGFKKIWPYILGSFLIVVIGVGTGWMLTKNKGSSISAPGTKVTSQGAGVKDTSEFKDTATGILEDGGISGEGQYHLTRSGGVSQTVYLTSTSVDLSSFVGKKVQVWGQTLSARKAGWLMDVGKVQVVE